MGDNIRNSVRKWGGGGPVLLVPNKLLSKQLNHIPNQRRIAGKKGSESAAMFIWREGHLTHVRSRRRS